MADKTKLIEIDINLDEAIKQTAKLKEQMISLSSELKQVAESEGTTSAAYIEKAAMLKAVTSQMKTYESITVNITKANISEQGSVEQLRRELSAVTAKWKELQDTQREDSDEGKKLTAQKLELTNALKKLESATGDNRRNVGNYEESVKGLRQELKDLKAVMLSNEEGSDKYNAALKRSSQITLEMREMNEKIKGSTMDFGDIMKNVTGTARGFASGLEVVMGVQGLFGVKSEELEKQLVKIQGAMALVEGLKGLEEGGKAFGRLLTQIKTFASEANKALMATTIGLLVAGVLLLIEYWDDLNEAMSDTPKVMRDMAETSKAATIETKRQVDLLNIQDDLLKRQGKTEKEIIAMKIKANDDYIFALKVQIAYQEYLNKKQLEAARANKENNWTNKILDFVPTFSKTQEENIKKAKEKINGIFGIDTEKNIRETEESGKKTLQELEKQLTEAENTKAKYLNNIDKLNHDASNKEKKIAEEKEKKIREFSEKRNKAQEAFAKIFLEESKKEAIAAIKQMEDELDVYKLTELEKLKTVQERAQKELFLESNLSTEKRKLGLITEDEYQKQLAQLQRNANETIRKANEDARAVQQAAQYDAVKNDFQAQMELEKAMLDQKYEQEIAYAENIGADTYWIEEKFSNARKELNQKEQDAKLAIASSFAGQLASLAGESTAIGKAAAVAQTVINTYKGAQSAFAETPGGIVIKTIAAGLATAAGLANVKKILSVKANLPNENKGVSTGSVASASTISMPINSANIQTGVNQGIIARGASSLQGDKTIIQPVLVVDDVTNKQMKKNEISTTSVL